VSCKMNEGRSNIDGASLRLAAARIATSACILVLIVLSGCLTAPVYTLPAIPEPLPCLAPAQGQDTVVGLAVSGGGSRAALFAAGAFEELAKLKVGADTVPVLDRVSYISSVSGGSLASAYYVLKKPTRTIPMVDAQGEVTGDYKKFFSDFKEAMAQNYEGPLFRRNLLKWRWFNPAFTAKSLAEILGEDYFGVETFGELAEREKRGDAPRLMVNTTLYNDGRRFLLSTIPQEQLLFNWAEAVARVATTAVSPGYQATLQMRAEQLNTVTPQDLHLNVCATKVAASVAGSMSFPPIIGPISLMDSNEQRYWHVGDGGMSDNTGGESLLMLMLRGMQEGRFRRVLLIAIDSSFPFEVGGVELDKRQDAFSIFNYDYSRIPSIMEERSLAYRGLFLHLAQQLKVTPGPDRIALIRLRHTDAEWAEDLSDLPDSCREEKVNWKSPKDVGQQLAGVVTRLWLESTCDRDLVVTAAAKVVRQKESMIKAFLEQ